MTKIIVSAIALFGALTVSASSLSLPIGSTAVVREYLEKETSTLLVNFTAENPWTIVWADEKELVEGQSNLLEQASNLVHNVLRDATPVPESENPGNRYSVTVTGYKNPRWQTFNQINHVVIKKDISGAWIIPASAYEVNLGFAKGIPITVPDIKAARAVYTDAGGAERVTTSEENKTNPLAGVLKVYEDKQLLFVPCELAIGKYPGTLTLSFKDGHDEVFDLQPSRIAITGIEKGEDIALTIRGVDLFLFAVEASTDLKVWTEVGKGFMETESTVFHVPLCSRHYGFYRARTRDPEPGSGR